MGNTHPSCREYPCISSIVLHDEKMATLDDWGEEKKKTQALIGEFESLMEIPSLTVRVDTKFGQFVYRVERDVDTPTVVVELGFDRNHFVLIYEGKRINLGVYHNHLLNTELLEGIRPGITRVFDELLIKHGVKAYVGPDGFRTTETRPFHTGNNCFPIAVVFGILLKTSSEMEFLKKKIEGLSFTERKVKKKEERKVKKKEEKNCTQCTYLCPIGAEKCEMCGSPQSKWGVLPSPKGLPPPPPSWECLVCTFQNNQYIPCCEMCHTTKGTKKK